MPDDNSIDRVLSRRLFSFLRLFDTAAIALSPASVVIAAIATVLVNISWSLFGHQRQFTPLTPALNETTERWLQSLKTSPISDFVTDAAFLYPWSSVVKPTFSILESSGSWSTRFEGIVQLLLAIGIWSLAGTILCRRSATLFVGNDESTLRSAIQYSRLRCRASATAPLIPLFTALMIGLIIAGIGFVGRLPFVGLLWLMIASPVVMILGFAIAFLLLVSAMGWPLMVAAVATDDCDSFGALSRAYSCLTGRPWHAFGFGLISLLIGIILMLMVKLFIETTLFCAMSCTGLGRGAELAQASLLSPLNSLSHVALSGIGTSFFWSATTVVYLLLRQEVDRMPLDRLALDDNARPTRDPLPVVGIPATDALKQSNGQTSAESD